MQLLLRCENPKRRSSCKMTKKSKPLGNRQLKRDMGEKVMSVFLGIHSKCIHGKFLRKIRILILQWRKTVYNRPQCTFVICVTIHMTHDIVLIYRESSSPYASFNRRFKNIYHKIWAIHVGNYSNVGKCSIHGAYGIFMDVIVLWLATTPSWGPPTESWWENHPGCGGSQNEDRCLKKESPSSSSSSSSSPSPSPSPSPSSSSRSIKIDQLWLSNQL